MSRYVRGTTITFAELQTLLGITGPVQAIEIDHKRGMVTIIHHNMLGIPDGSQVPVYHWEGAEQKRPDQSVLTTIQTSPALDTIPVVLFDNEEASRTMYDKSMFHPMWRNAAKALGLPTEEVIDCQSDHVRAFHKRDAHD